MEFIISFLLATLIMEFVAWASHKYIMHGLGWILHSDHHRQPKGFFQKNDWFILIFAIPSWLLIMIGGINSTIWAVGSGFGIAFYGLIYFLFHEILIHKRFPKLRKILFGKANAYYYRVLIKAHHDHHRVLTKNGAVSFGLLLVNPKYYKLIEKKNPMLK